MTSSYFQSNIGIQLRSHICSLVIVDAPGAPYGLIVDYGQGSDVTLTWLSPQSDGGSTVTEYLVERMESGTDKWIKINTAR